MGRRRGHRGSALSPREAEVVRWLTAGLSRADIGRRLGVREETIKTHLRAVYRKLGVPGRFAVAAQLAAPRSGASDRERPSG